MKKIFTPTPSRSIHLTLLLLGFFSLGLLVSSPKARAGLMYDYSRLATMDLDEMTKIVRSKIKESRGTDGAKSVPLKEALQAVYSRPDTDGLIEKVAGPLKNELEDLDAWESSVENLIKEAIGALQNKKFFKPKVQVTYAVFLENLIADFKPQLATKGFEYKMVKKIQDAHIVLSKEAEDNLRLSVMKAMNSPSKTAEEALAKLGAAANPA